MTLPFYRTQAIRFRCSETGRCCREDSEAYVFLSSAEVESIRAHLGLSRYAFRRAYLDRLEDEALVLRLDDQGGCCFLSARGCEIYPVRPRQCRSYPFWPEIMRSQAAWRAEARRCEGIGQGEVITPESIEAWLAPESGEPA